MSRKISFFNESVKLDPNIKLVYIDNPNSSPNTTGTVQVARIHRSLIINKDTWFEVTLLTDVNGDLLNTNDKLLIQDIVSNRKYRTIKNKKFYHLRNEITATNFANNEPNNSNNLESISRSALGSGVYGIYLSSLSEAKELSVDNRLFYEIDITEAYDVQDKEHGESITIASISTNRYLDTLIPGINQDEIFDIIKNDNIESLVILWNIVFYRSKRYISYEQLEDILTNYLMEYFTNHELADKRTNVSLIALPINYIMKEMGYNGLIADDLFNNGWDRGCVSYLFEESDALTEGKALY